MYSHECCGTEWGYAKDEGDWLPGLRALVLGAARSTKVGEKPSTVATVTATSKGPKMHKPRVKNTADDTEYHNQLDGTRQAPPLHDVTHHKWHQNVKVQLPENGKAEDLMRLGTEPVVNVCLPPSGDCDAVQSEESTAAAADHRKLDPMTNYLPLLVEAMEDSAESFALELVVEDACQPPSPQALFPMQCSDDHDPEQQPVMATELCPECPSPATTKPHVALPGKLGECFERTHLLGKGQFGEVWHATTHAQKESVVIKQIWDRSTFNHYEFEAPYKHPHHNFAKMFYFVSSDSCVYIIQEYVAGNTLEDIWKILRLQGDEFHESEMDDAGSQLLDALDHLAQHRIIHRDIKPSNIVISQVVSTAGVRLRPVIVDFGLSEILVEGEEVRCVSRIRGSLAYMAPECLRMCSNKSKTCRKGYNTQSDIWSLGMTFVQIFSRQMPWRYYAKNKEELENLLRTKPEFMQEYASNPHLVKCSKNWREILVAMLAPESCRRPTASSLRHTLEDHRKLSLPALSLLQDDYQ